MNAVRILKIIATVCFVIATVGVAVPVNLVALGLALWCGSELL